MAALALSSAFLAGKRVNAMDNIRGFGAKVTGGSNVLRAPFPLPVSAVFTRQEGGPVDRRGKIKTEVSHFLQRCSSGPPPHVFFLFFLAKKNTYTTALYAAPTHPPSVATASLRIVKLCVCAHGRVSFHPARRRRPGRTHVLLGFFVFLFLLGQ